ncbi:MAG: CHRD domain-containing protein [Isosphaeraceae bacterium]
MFRSMGLALAAIALLGGAPSARAGTIIYYAVLSGPNEDPPNDSPGTGIAWVTVDDVANTLRVQVTFSDLLGVTTAAHIHAPTAEPLTGVAGVATQVPSFTGFPLGVTSGTMDETFDMTQESTWNPAYITANGGTAAGAQAAFLTALAEGRAYFNIHTDLFPRGEIRGFLVPEPSSLLLGGLAAGSLGVFRLGRRHFTTRP